VETPTPLKVLFVTSELTPLISTGGLAEVAAALPRALRAEGHDVRIVMPCYQSIPEADRGEEYCLCEAELDGRKEFGALRKRLAPDSDIPLYLIEHEGYFGRAAPYGIGACEYEDNAERFCFFCLALLHAIPQTQWMPDIIHCNDWHTAALPAFLRTRFAVDPAWEKTPTLFTIHNLAFQGRYRPEKLASTGLDPALFHPECLEYEGDINLMKAAIAFATKINTVSPRYAQEIQTLEYGDGLDGMLRTRQEDLSGILNGVDYDLWDPETDPYLAAHYSQKDFTGKAVCKKALQKHFGLAQRDVPLFGVVSRLYWQKGLDLMIDALDHIMEMDLQIVVLGSGDPALEEQLANAVQNHPQQVGLDLKFNVALAHQVQAGSDFFLMPSRYEPCGLGQMYSMAYGAIPIVRRTGGLADSVRDINPVHLKHKTATGISFVSSMPKAMVRSFNSAVELYRDAPTFQQVRRTCMEQDFSWDRSCQEYIQLYREALAQTCA
jgi:starch synthase